MQDQRLLRQPVVTTFACLVAALEADSAALHPFIVPIVAHSLAQRKESGTALCFLLAAECAESVADRHAVQATCGERSWSCGSC